MINENIYQAVAEATRYAHMIRSFVSFSKVIKEQVEVEKIPDLPLKDIDTWNSIITTA